MKIILGLVVVSVGVRSFAGTIITNNLPAGTIIVNINSTQDYAAAYDGDKAHWYSPGSTLGPSQILQYTFSPGNYTFRIVDPADAAQLFPTLTAAQTNQIYTGWTFNSPWLTTYNVFDSSATNNASEAQLFDGASGTNYGNGSIRTFGGPQAAYDAAIADGSYKLIRTGPAGYDSLNFTNVYTVTNTQTLLFVIPDQGPQDNNGGVSVLVTKIADLSVNWFKVAGGGGASSDGTLRIQGTAGQADAGVMSDGTLQVRGGFWVSAIQTLGLPYLFVGTISPTQVKIYWVGTTKVTVQTNGNLASPNWTPYGGPVTTVNGTNSVTLTPAGNLFIRLAQ